MPRCPRDGARREERGLARNPARGLGRGATTSRSRPPSVTPIASGLGNWFTSFAYKFGLATCSTGCASAGPRRHGPAWTRSGAAACPRWRRPLPRRASSAAHSPESRRLGLAQADARERGRHLVGLVDQQPAGDHALRQHRSAAPAARPGQQQRREQVRGDRRAPRRPDRRAGRAGARRASTPFTRAFAPRRLHATGSLSSATTGAQPSRAAAIASTPDPQPRSTNPPPGAAASSSISSRHSRVVAWAPVPNACPGSITRSISGPRARAPTAAARSAVLHEHQRPVELPPALGPVVGDLGACAPRPTRRRPPPSARAAPAARPARRTPRTRRRRRRRRPPRPRSAPARAARPGPARPARAGPGPRGGAQQSPGASVPAERAPELAEHALVGAEVVRRSASRPAARELALLAVQVPRNRRR